MLRLLYEANPLAFRPEHTRYLLLPRATFASKLVLCFRALGEVGTTTREGRVAACASRDFLRSRCEGTKRQ